MNKDRFHNQLALNLGCKRILDKGYNIKIEFTEQDIPVVSIYGIDGVSMVCNLAKDYESICSTFITDDIRVIIDTAYRAYADSNIELIPFYK